MADSIQVLHVDDEPDFAEMVADFLDRERPQFTVATATSASEGRDRLASEEFDCVVSDYDMPGTDGIEFLDTVRKAHPDLPFILYTGKGSEEVASEAISAGVTDYLQKESGTSQFEMLAHRISNAVESYRSQKKVEQTRIKKTELEAKYQSITEDVLNATEVGTIILDASFEIVWCSRAIAEFFGTDRNTLTGADRGDILREEIAPTMDDSDAFLDTVSDTSEDSSHTERIECHVRAGDGRAERWLEYRSHPIETGLFEGGRVEIYTEVTDRVERERALERTERRYRALLDHAHDAIARVEFDGETPVIREATPEFRALFEPSGADVVGQDIDEVVASDAEFERAREISLRTKEGESMRGEATRDTVDGPRDFIWQAVPIQDPETGAFDGGFAIYTDITEQRNRERELERYREFIEQSTDIVTVLDASGRIEFTSPAVEAVLGYGQSELVGEDPLEYTHPEDRGRVRVAVEQALAERDTVRTVEFRFEHADGSWVWVESRGRNRLDDPNIEGLVLSQRDITDRVEREQRLQRERDRLDEFASIVSHDLRNPLNVAEGRVELAQQDCESPHLDGVARAHDRIRGLIEDLLILARQGKSIDEQETVDLASTVDQCWQTVETADASLFVETERTVQADANRLRQLLTNLFRNAIEHAGDDVTVTVGDLDTREGFYVADDGPGIDSGEREAVFETGYSTADEGTGFGLNIVQEIAEAHEWTIEIADSETAGARFEIAGTDTTDSQPE